MYVPEHFAVTEPDEIAALLASARLGTLVTYGPQGLFATPMPFVHDAARRVLAGHMALANPHRSHDGGGEALVIFNGPEAYVSPSLYPSKSETGRVVPTWNYEALHVYGRLTWTQDPAAMLANVTALSDRFEAERERPWAVSDAPSDYVLRTLRGVVGVDLAITRVEAKRKLSQNKPDADRAGVIDGLTIEAPALAAAMRKAWA